MDKVQCPVCEYHGFESYLETRHFANAPPSAVCSRIKHQLLFFRERGFFSPNNGDYQRFITCFWNGKWRTYDKYDDTVYDKPTLMRLEESQVGLLKKQIYMSQLTWMWCAKQLNVSKDVARIIGNMVNSAPYAPMYTCESAPPNLFALLFGRCCRRKKLKL